MFYCKKNAIFDTDSYPNFFLVSQGKLSPPPHADNSVKKKSYDSDENLRSFYKYPAGGATVAFKSIVSHQRRTSLIASRAQKNLHKLLLRWLSPS